MGGQNLHTLSKVAGQENPGDMFTNYLDQATMKKRLAKINLRYEAGRPETAPSLTHCVFTPDCIASGFINFR